MSKKLPPVDVNSDLTPITRKPIDPVDSSNWNRLHVSQLHDELIRLQNRYYAAMEMNKPELCKQIQVGISTIESIIKKKQDKDGTLLI